MSSSEPNPTPTPPEPRATERLTEAVRNFQSAETPADRSLLTNDFVELATGGVPSHDVALALGSLLKTEPDTDVRLDILDRLVILDDPDMIFQVAIGLSLEQPRRVRSTAVQLLDSYGDKRVVPMLWQTAATDPDPVIRQAAANAAKSLNDAEP